MLPIIPKITPKIFVTKSALIAMANEVLQSPEIETAWGLWGIVMKDGQSVIVTHVIKPIPQDIEQAYTSVAFGGDGQVQALRWLTANKVQLEKHLGRGIEGRCAYLYKGHSHHQLKFGEYSSTDITSMRDIVKVDGLEVAVGPLALLVEPGKWNFKKGNGLITIDEHTSLNIKFYYYSKLMLQAGKTEPIIITPKIIETKAAPVLPPLAWQFVNDADFYEQLRHLLHYGAHVEIAYREVKGGPPYEIVFTVNKSNWRSKLLIVTQWNYPETPASFFTIPIEGRTATEQGDYADEKLLTGPVWNPGEDFIEAVFRLESRGEL